MTYLPICPRKIDPGRVGSPGPRDPIARLIQHIPGETDLDSLERIALSEGFYSDADAAGRAISRAIGSGSLIPRDEFLTRLQSKRPLQSRPATGSIRALGVLSSGRWDVVAKSVAGIISGGDFLEGGLPLVICDDSGTGPSPELRLLRGDSPGPIQLRLIGREDRERYLQTLLASPELHNVDRSALSFGLLGSPEWTCRAGANRNWWLLESAGDKSVLVDDDEGPEYLTHGSGGQGARASSDFHPLSFRPLDENQASSAAPEALSSCAGVGGTGWPPPSRQSY